MISQLLVGGFASLGNIALHALFMLPVAGLAGWVRGKIERHSWMWLIGTMIATVAVLMAAHILEVLVWALVYWIFNAAPRSAGLVYFAFVNYTTLGYGDVVPNERWRLLGPMTAMNGVMLFGWSTALIFEMLRRTLTLTRLGPHRGD